MDLTDTLMQGNSIWVNFVDHCFLFLVANEKSYLYVAFSEKRRDLGFCCRDLWSNSQTLWKDLIMSRQQTCCDQLIFLKFRWKISLHLCLNKRLWNQIVCCLAGFATKDIRYFDCILFRKLLIMHLFLRLACSILLVLYRLFRILLWQWFL